MKILKEKHLNILPEIKILRQPLVAPFSEEEREREERKLYVDLRTSLISVTVDLNHPVRHC